MWFTKSFEAVLEELKVNPISGLSEEEVTKRQSEYGKNRLAGKKKKSIISLFFNQLKDWLIYVLLAAVIITSFYG